MRSHSSCIIRHFTHIYVYTHQPTHTHARTSNWRRKKKKNLIEYKLFFRILYPESNILINITHISLSCLLFVILPLLLLRALYSILFCVRTFWMCLFIKEQMCIVFCATFLLYLPFILFAPMLLIQYLDVLMNIFSSIVQFDCMVFVRCVDLYRTGEKINILDLVLSIQFKAYKLRIGRIPLRLTTEIVIRFCVNTLSLMQFNHSIALVLCPSSSRLMPIVSALCAFKL